MNILRRLRLWVQWRRHDTGLRDELEFHRTEIQRALEQEGMSAADAARASRRRMGNVTLTQEDVREIWIWRWLDSTLQDIRYAVRTLRCDRAFSAAALVTLGLGIGANTMVFTLVNTILLRGLPIAEPEQLLLLGTRNADDRGAGVSWLDYRDWAHAARTVSSMTASEETTMSVADDGRAPERVRGAFVSANNSALFGFRPAMGRDFVEADDRDAAAPVVIINHRLWLERYQSDPQILGRTIRVDGVPSAVIGVMAAGFHVPAADVWVPLSRRPNRTQETRAARGLQVVARLGPGATPAQAQSEIQSIGTVLAREYPETNTGVRPTVQSFIERYVGQPLRLVFTALLGVVASLLLIGCANVANLLLARTGVRTREIAIRLAIGASRARIVRQLIVECLLLSALAGVIGLGLGALGVHVFSVTTEQIGKPEWITFGFDARVFAYIAAVCIATALVFGLLPALHASKTNLIAVIKDGTQAASRMPARRLTGALVIFQLALTLVLLTGAGARLQNLVSLYRLDLGVDTSRIVTARVALPETRYPSPDTRALFYDRLQQQLEGTRAIGSAAMASVAPFEGTDSRHIEIDGISQETGVRQPAASTIFVGPRYFDVIGLRLLRGSLTERGGAVPPGCAVVSQEFVSRYLGDGNPIGRRIALARDGKDGTTGSSPWLVIVAIAPSIRQEYPMAAGPVVYVPYGLEPQARMTVIMRSDTATSAPAERLRSSVARLDADLPLFDVMTLDERLAQIRWPYRVFSAMFAIFAAIALTLGATGLYAVTAYSVSARQREIGIRMALGALKTRVQWLILRRAVAHLAAGMVLGLAATAAFWKVLRPMSATSSFNPLLLMGVGVLLVVPSLAGCYWVTRQAAAVDPLASLRVD